MTKLLVSVRNATEAEIALAEGVDLIDVKEPDRGALGAADPATIHAVAKTIAGRVPLSAALGELHARARLPASLSGKIGYAKFGLAGCTARGDWAGEWRAAIGELPASTAAVGVAYADWRDARAPDPWHVLREAKRLGCRGLLIDTFDKAKGNLLDWAPLAELEKWIEATSGFDLLCVVAGGLTVAEIERILPLSPDYVAVRGAACGSGRGGAIEPARVATLVRLVRGARAPLVRRRRADRVKNA
jgi:(5-formylfuran-3-yl)methyl phosphate synthase